MVLICWRILRKDIQGDVPDSENGVAWTLMTRKNQNRNEVLELSIYRNVQLSFWTDNKIEDEFTPEDKYFYLYLLTNPQTNICGCYEISYSQITRQTGYNKETIMRLLNRFDKVHRVIKFNADTKEVLVLHWYKYNWSKSEKVLSGVLSVAKHIKCNGFKKYVFDTVEHIKNDTLCIGYTYHMETFVSDSVSDTDTVNNNKDIDIIKSIINYLNSKCNTRYRYSTDNTKKHIRARLKDGYVFEDFCTVIDKKSKEWLGTDMEKFLCPDTLFGTKFEKYLNQNNTAKKKSDVFEDWRNA